MKRVVLHFIVAFFAFLIGIGVFLFWLYSLNAPYVPAPRLIEVAVVHYDPPMSAEERKFWEKEILGRFKEKPLEKSAADESYRFILIPTFHGLVSIRVERSSDERFLTTKKLSGVGGFGLDKVGKLSYEKTRPLTEEEWLAFTNLLDGSDFWNLPWRDKDAIPITDGASWTMEAVKNGRYHQIDRITPDKEFLESCVYLLKLSGIEEDEYKGYWK